MLRQLGPGPSPGLQRLGGVPLALLQRMKPWMAAVTLTTAALTRAGFDSGLGIDKQANIDGTHIPNPPTATIKSVNRATGVVTGTATGTTVKPPVSGPVADRWIDVDLSSQRLTAYQGKTAVFSALISGGLPNTPTVVGRFKVYVKLRTTRMRGPGYDLPGVPWCSYIFWNGISIHGTYWHNNYGTPMSHGCINLLPQAAKWIYRWTDPVVPYDKNYLKADGTPVIVF